MARDDRARVSVHETVLRVNVRWMTPLGDETASTSYASSRASRPSQTRTPRPSRIGHLHQMQRGRRARRRGSRVRRWGRRRSGRPGHRRLRGRSERVGRGSVEEVERGAALHLHRGPRVVGEHEGRRVERRVRPPPALPVRVVVPPGRAELVRAHDLGAEADAVALRERVVDALDPPAVLPPLRAQNRVREHPLVQALAGMAEGRLGGLRLSGREAVERDGQVVDPGA